MLFYYMVCERGGYDFDTIFLGNDRKQAEKEITEEWFSLEWFHEYYTEFYLAECAKELTPTWTTDFQETISAAKVLIDFVRGGKK